MKVRLLTALGILIFGLPILLFSKYIVYRISDSTWTFIGYCRMGAASRIWLV